MPSWKKVIISGSNAALNSLTVTNGITGSLFGTASYANFAATASNAQNAQDILIYVKNVTGAQIDKGKVVRISGATGDNPLIATASYESDSVSANTLGITTQNIPNDSFGYVITEGTLLGINTDAFSAGQLLYLGPTGSIIGTAPVAPLHNVRLGQVLRVQLNNGSMYVRIDNGYELGELHDVVDNTTTSSYGDLLVKSGSVWTNSKQLTGSYGLTGSLNIINGGITGSLFGTASYATNAGNAATIDVNVFGSNVESYLLMSNVAGTTGVAIGGDADLRYNASTNRLTAVNISATSLTGSLLGTASFATNASIAVSSSQATTASFALNATSASFTTSASFASTASFVNPLRQTVQVTGSLNITGSSDITGPLNVTNSSGPGISMNTTTVGRLTYQGQRSVDWTSRVLQRSNNNISLNWENSTLNDANEATVLSWANGLTGSIFGTSSYATLSATASFITGSNVYGPFGSNSITSASFAVSSSRAVSSSFASTASFVNTLNQNVLITGSLSVGVASAGASENTLTLGARDNGSEGGQLGLNAPGGTYTSASMIDNYNNSFRILKGTNAGSTGLVAQWNLHNNQMQLPGYTSPTSIPGTVSGLLAFDTSGNVITTTTGSGGGGGVTINNNVDNYVITATGTANTLNGESGLQYNGTSLAVTGQVTSSGAIISTANGAMYFRGGDDAEFWDINVANTVGIYGQQTQAVAGLKLGSSGSTLYGSGSRLGINTTSPVATLDVNGNLYVASGITGSLFGTASWATNATTATTATNANNVAVTDTTTGTGPYYVMFVDGTTGNRAVRVDSSTLQFNATTNTLTVPNLAGTASWATNATSATTATSANTLTNTRTIWGQNFNGSANITGNLTSVGTISGSAGVDLTITAGNGARITLMNPGADGVRFGTSNTLRWSVDGATGYLSAQGAQTIRTTTGNLTISTGAGNGHILLTPDGTGSVGIGTTSPGNKLQISTADSSNQLLRLGVSYDTSRNLRGGINWHDAVNTTGQISTEYDGTMVSMVFGSLYNSAYNSNTLMTLRGNGNLGIGTSSPSQKLHVSGSARITGAIYDSSNSAGSSGQVLSSTGTGTAWVTGGGGGSAFPYTGSALITGSLGITGSLSTTGSDAFINGVRVGRGKGNIITNTAVGTGSLSSITTGPENTAIGREALTSTTTGANNTALGSTALFTNIGGGDNTAIGAGAANLSTGTGNTAIGAWAASNLSSGDYNIFIGDYTAYQATTSNRSTVIGGYTTPGGLYFNENQTLSVGKHDTSAEAYYGVNSAFPHFWAPETQSVGDTAAVTLIGLDYQIYSSIFMDYNVEDNNGNMRAGTIKAIWNFGGTTIKWTEETTDSIGDTSGLVITVETIGGSIMGVVLTNNNGYTAYVNSTSRLLIRPTISNY